MKKPLVPVAVTVLFLGLTAAGGVHSSGRPEPLLAFDSMYAVDGPFLTPDNAINGVRGDDLPPWELESAHGTLMADGQLELHIRGLVFAHDDSVPAHLQGKNDERSFRVLLSCITEGNHHHNVQATVLSEPFEANVDGDGDLDTVIELPVPCVAPILFVVSGSEEQWFAVNGVGEERE